MSFHQDYSPGGSFPLDTYEDHERRNGHVTYSDEAPVTIELDERRYVPSDGDESDDEMDYPDAGTGERLSQLPSRKISALGYKSVMGVRRRKSSSSTKNYQKMRAKSKVRKATHIYNEWRNNPEELEQQVKNNWKEEDEDPDTESFTDEVRTQRRIEELREMSIHLSRKKQLRDALRKETLKQGSTLKRNQGIGCWKNLKYSLSIRQEHAKFAITSAIRSMGLWEGHLKAFASHFGTDVTAYFLFLRWLFVANTLIGLLVFLFLYIPQLLYNVFVKDVFGFVSRVDLGEPDRSVMPQYKSNWEGGREILTGKGDNTSGVFENTGMYYGHYTDTLILSDDKKGASYWYNMKISYLLTYGAYFLIYFLVIAISVAKSYRKNFIESSDKFTFQYVLKILDGWDYNIDATNTAHSKKKNMHRDLREFCASNRGASDKGNCCDKMILVLFRLGAMFIMTAVIIACGFIVYYVLEKLTGGVGSHPIIRDATVPLIVTSINTFLPIVFSFTAGYLKFEYPKSAVYTTLIFTMLLYGVTLGVYFGYTIAPCAGKDLADVINKAGGLNETGFECLPCWETRLGERAYSLVFLDFVFGVVVTLVSEVLRRLVTQFCCQSLEKKKNQEGKSLHPQFEIARNTMVLIYNQFLLWLGIYYSPLLTVVVVVKLWLIFYLKRLTVMNACIPTTKPWRAAKMHTIFLVLLFLGFILCAIMFGISITLVTPSTSCGPFVNLTSASVSVTSELSKLEAAKTGVVMDIILSPGVVVGIIVILCVVVHYVRVTSAGRKTLISLLKIQITLESKDKAYLRTMLDKVHKHKMTRLEPRPVQCECEGACNCGYRGPHHESRDSLAELRPNRGHGRIFAKQRSNTSGSLLSGGEDVFGSREDLSKSRISNASNAGQRRAKDSQTSQQSTPSYHNMSAIEGNRGSQAMTGRESGYAGSSPPARRQPRPAPRQSSSAHINGSYNDDSYLADERF